MVKVLKARPLIYSPITEAKIDIIIPFFGQYQKLHDLCKSIWFNTKSNPYHLYLVDDCSPNKTYMPAFRKAPHTTVLQNDKQSGFAESLRKGFSAGKNEWVVFMHSDCRVETNDWLTGLLKTYLRTPKAALVSPRTNNPGIENANLCSTKEEKQSDYVLEKGYLPLYCTLCRRDLFQRINGFIKPYPFRYYEDEELSYRIRAYGLREVVSGESWIFHHGGATVSTLLKLQEDQFYRGPDYKKIIEENRDRCIADVRLLVKPAV